MHQRCAADQHPPRHPAISELLGDGSQCGMNIQYSVQPSTDDMSQAFMIGKDFLCKHPINLLLGDNILYGHDLVKLLTNTNINITKSVANVFAYPVKDPERYCVVEFDVYQRAISVKEKPKAQKSNYSFTGFYFYDNQVCEIAAIIRPSVCEELEVIDLNQCYLDQRQLNVETMGRGFDWLYTVTHDCLLEFARFIYTLQKRQCLQLASPEEIVLRQGWINAAQLAALADPVKKNGFVKYLFRLLQ